MNRAEEAALERYMQSRAFKRRATKLQAKCKAQLDRGEELDFSAIAKELQIPLEVCIGGFEHAMAKAGMPLGHRKGTLQ